MKFITTNKDKNITEIFNSDFIKRAGIHPGKSNCLFIEWQDGTEDDIQLIGPEDCKELLKKIYVQGNQAPNKFIHHQSKKGVKKNESTVTN